MEMAKAMMNWWTSMIGRADNGPRRCAASGWRWRRNLWVNWSDLGQVRWAFESADRGGNHIGVGGVEGARVVGSGLARGGPRVPRYGAVSRIAATCPVEDTKGMVPRPRLASMIRSRGRSICCAHGAKPSRTFGWYREAPVH